MSLLEILASLKVTLLLDTTACSKSGTDNKFFRTERTLEYWAKL